MEKITIEGVEYEIVGGIIEKGDLYLYNNPNTTKKNVLHTCQFIHDNGAIQPKSQFLSLREIPTKWCTKIKLIPKP
jgi:hypothetical protein